MIGRTVREDRVAGLERLRRGQVDQEAVNVVGDVIHEIATLAGTERDAGDQMARASCAAPLMAEVWHAASPRYNRLYTPQARAAANCLICGVGLERGGDVVMWMLSALGGLQRSTLDRDWEEVSGVDYDAFFADLVEAGRRILQDAQARLTRLESAMETLEWLGGTDGGSF